MKNAVNASLYTGLSRILAALLFVMGFWTHDGLAASVRWEVLPDRERVTVQLNKEEGFAGQVTRVAPKALLLDLGVPTGGMGQDLAPENANFFEMSEPRGRALGFFMKTAAFGFVVTRPDTNTVIINAYADPLGERWTPQGLAPAPSSVLSPEGTPPAGSGSGAGETAVQNESVEASSAGTSEETPAVSQSPDTGVAERPVSFASETEVHGVVRGRIETTPMTPAGVDNTEAAATTNVTEESDSRPSPAPASPARLRSVGSDEPGMTEFRSRINSGNLTDWEAQHGGGNASPGAASVPVSSQGQSVGQPGTQPETPGGEAPGSAEGREGTDDTGEAAATPPAPVKEYFDDKGNPIPPPPDPVEAIADVRKDITAGNYKGALEKVTALLTHPELSREQTEDVLHLHAEMLFMANQDKLAENFDAIMSASISAMNYNQDSPRNAGAYLRLGYINLQAGNTVEANAYFNQLRQRYPLDENIALTYYYWGQYYYDHNEMQKAADEYQYIISNYSENKIAREASLGLTRCYVALGYYQEAFDIIDYVDRRWPRLYLEAPAVLELMGDVGYRLGNLDFALDRYMIYYNLMPNGPSSDVILTRIGDVYAMKRQLSAAKTAYTEAERLFPGKDGGLVAMMRLAEVGINDKPEVQAMMSAFQDATGNAKTVDIYRKIINEHPDSELVPLAMLKLAMWYFVNNKYEEALGQCTELVKRFPGHELVSPAEELAMKAFTSLATESATQNRPGQVVASWSANPIIKKQEEALSPESRVALADSMMKQDDPDGALEMVRPMFLGFKDPDHSEEALYIALDIYKEFEKWEDIEKLGEQINLWELTDKARNRLDYALALSRENLGKSAEAAPLWSRLASTGTLSEPEQAYAEYFLARDAEVNRRLQDAYVLGRSSLNRFLQLAKAEPEKADTGKINSLLSSLMDICETSGRYMEALTYANDFLATLPEQDEQRQGVLFRIAGIYKKQGNDPEWKKTLTDLSARYPDSVYGRSAASQLNSARLADDAAQFSPTGAL